MLPPHALLECCRRPRYTHRGRARAGSHARGRAAPLLLRAGAHAPPRPLRRWRPRLRRRFRLGLRPRARCAAVAVCSDRRCSMAVAKDVCTCVCPCHCLCVAVMLVAPPVTRCRLARGARAGDQTRRGRRISGCISGWRRVGRREGGRGWPGCAGRRGAGRRRFGRLVGRWCGRGAGGGAWERTRDVGVERCRRACYCGSGHRRAGCDGRGRRLRQEDASDAAAAVTLDLRMVRIGGL